MRNPVKKVVNGNPVRVLSEAREAFEVTLHVSLHARRIFYGARDLPLPNFDFWFVP